MFYNYESSKTFCESIGLVWLGDDFLREADAEAKQLKFTQKQVDSAMRHYLWRVKFLFTPKNYSFLGRILIALYFLTGIQIKPRSSLHETQTRKGKVQCRVKKK